MPSIDDTSSPCCVFDKMVSTSHDETNNVARPSSPQVDGDTGSLSKESVHSSPLIKTELIDPMKQIVEFVGENPIPSAVLNKKLDCIIDGLDAIAKDIKERGDSSSGDSSPCSVRILSENVWSTISGIREGDWKHFMNRFSQDEPVYAIEVLVVGTDFRKEVADEEGIRHRLKVAVSTEQPLEIVNKTQDSKKWIERIRVRSKPLLEIFSRVTGYAWGDKPRTFTRPFKYLVHFHEIFKDELQRMELTERDLAQHISEPFNLHMSELSSGAAAHQAEREQDGKVAKESDNPGITVQRSAALEDLRCYIKFAEEKFMPQYWSLRSADPSASLRVRFDDLWYLFKPGDLIYLPSRTAKRATESVIRNMGLINVGNLSHESSMQQKIWKVRGLYSLSTADEEDTEASLKVHCYYLDYDGSSYGAISGSFDIECFDGEKELRELDFYPVRYASRANELLQEAREIGALFVKYVEKWHLSYDGWSLVTNPTGVPILDPESPFLKQQERPQHIQSDVIIDFKEAFNYNPAFKNSFGDFDLWASAKVMVAASTRLDTILEWSDAGRSKLLASHREVTFQMDDIDDSEHDAFLLRDPYLNQAQSKPVPSGEDLALLPRRIFAFALNECMFVPIDVRYVKVIHFQEDAFDHLQLPDVHKRMIKAAVYSHLRRQNIESRLGENGSAPLRTQDFIRGKGRGLNIMLYGEPGVGKTATAEAVAQTTGRPLFPIACGTLTGGPRIEDKLNEMFRLAHLWSCVLLLDEADVFLTARSYGPKDIGSNGIVSIFLRKVEYFNGILFLTTNRIGKLDQAISSRIHLILHYKRLGEASIQEIFRINIKRLQEAEKQQHEVSGQSQLFIMEPDILRFAADHCQKYPKGRGAWNGRQIRNAFIVAASLARHEAQQLGDASFQPQLRYSHFEEVEKLTQEYNRFRAHVLGGDDSRKARLNEERDDDYEEDHSEPANAGHDYSRPTRQRRMAASSRFQDGQAHMRPTSSSYPHQSNTAGQLTSLVNAPGYNVKPQFSADPEYAASHEDYE